MLTRTTVASAALVLAPTIAYANTNSHSPVNGYLLWLVVVGFLAALIYKGWFAEDSGPAQGQMSPEEYDQAAAQLRAAGRHAEAKADYEEKLTRLKLKEAELAEVERFLASERAKLVGSNKRTAT